jgi:tRNA(Ile2) C34 agmatinyltransferase TiaS
MPPKPRGTMKPVYFEGDPCPKCGAMTLVLVKLAFRCMSCDYTSEKPRGR